MTTDIDFARTYGPFALVTGASSGIGASYAKALAARGMNLVLVARRLDRLHAMAATLEHAHGIKATACQIDLSQAEAAAHMLEATRSIDIGLVVSNAGFGLQGAHDGQDPAALTDMLMVNCHTPMQLARCFIPRLRARGKGGIIFTSSVEALLGMPYSAAYSASKGFVNRLAEGLWGELNADNIDVLGVCPGATDTEALARLGIDRALFPNLQSPDAVAALSLENIKNGPIYLPSAHYRAMFEKLAAMPKREALAAMARGRKS